MATAPPPGPTAAPFATLQPDLILDAVESFGVRCDGRMLALNSYENRVYQVGIEDGTPVIAKFYRPARWSDAQILEEHAFANELFAAELAVAAAVPDGDGKTLRHHEDHRVALFQRCPGDWPELDRPGRLPWIGRFLGRLHAVARTGTFNERPRVGADELGYDAMDALLDSNLLPPEEAERYRATATALLETVEAQLDAFPVRIQRLHGDCHPGNILWSEQGPTLVDLDDCRSGPAVQDLWMLVSGEPWEQRAQLEQILEGYTMFSAFDDAELELAEPLRALRMVYYAAWLARRWDDPAFPKAFPWFGTPGYWRGHVDDLRAQLERLGGS